MGLFSLFTQAAQSSINITEAREIVNQALLDALDTMQSMCANEGQLKVFNDYVKPEFIENKGPIQDGWDPVDIGDYMDFMGEIVEEGNNIMEEAYQEAQDILSELEEAIA